MTTSRHFNHLTNVAEQKFFEDLVVESIQIGGHDVHYIPRSAESNIILGETVQSTFSEIHTIEAYIENIESYGGQGDLMSKFGLMIQDDLDMKISRKRFSEVLGSVRSRPREGDLIYVGNLTEARDSFMNGVFEITYVSQLQPFWQLGRSAVYQIKCQKFAFSHETFDTGVDELDKIFEDIEIDPPGDNIEFKEKQTEMQDFSESNVFGDI